MKSLQEICLWATIGTADKALAERTLRVIRYCNSLSEWNDIVLFSVIDPAPFTDITKDLHVRVIQIPEMVDREAWMILVGRVMPVILKKYAYTMAIHDDGFPIDLSLWSSEFLDYDYIGAPWERNGLVGSGGCALTSSRLMNSMIELPWYSGSTNVDEWVCQDNVVSLMAQGLKFASPDVAERFCTETTGQDKPSFAYHGRNHATEKHRLAWEKLCQWEASR